MNNDQLHLFEIGSPPLVSLPYSVQTNDVLAHFESPAVPRRCFCQSRGASTITLVTRSR